MRSKSWGEWRKYSFSDRRDLLLCQDTIVVFVVYTFFKCAHPLLSFQSWHLLPPRHPVHRFPVYKHSPVTTHHALTTGICDRAINLIPSLQIHMFTWQQSPPGRISQQLSMSRTKDLQLMGLASHTVNQVRYSDTAKAWSEESLFHLRVILSSLSCGLYQFC